MRRDSASLKVMFGFVLMHKEIYALFNGRSRTIIKPNQKCSRINKILNTLAYP